LRDLTDELKIRNKYPEFPLAAAGMLKQNIYEHQQFRENIESGAVKGLTEPMQHLPAGSNV